jgi:tetratricopeptide (TPR) repeat protein
VANRYLYFILPGLVGGTLLAARSLLRGPLKRVWTGPGGDNLRRFLWVAVAALLAFFAWKTDVRASLWQSEAKLMVDAARAWPDGATAHILRARTAAQSGDVEEAVAQLRVAADRGIDHFSSLERDPGLQPLVGTPQFEALIRDMAGDWIALAHKRGYSTQPELRFLAVAHMRRGEYSEAVEALEAALATGGPLDEAVRQELAEARAKRAAQVRSGGAGLGPRR